MEKTLLLNKSEIGSLIDLDAVQLAVEDAYRSFNSGKVVQPDFMCVNLPDSHAGIDFKGGMDLGNGFLTIKASTGGYDNNKELGLPTGMNTVLLFDAYTSFLKCVMDATWITGCRTAAAGAISVKYLSREDANVLCVIGAGNQARRQLRAIMRVRNLSKVLVWNAFQEEMDIYVREMSQETGLPIYACETPEEAISQADIIVTTTRGILPPVVKRSLLKPGTHIAAIGADMPNKQELCTDVFKGAKIVNDSIHLCSTHGETHHALEEGVIKVSDIYGEIGEIILGKKPGRENPEEITIFDTVGMAVQDTATASMLYKGALEKNLGTWFDFMA